jgi:RNA polymerase sigma factor (TIGR02999 family)
MDNCFSLHSVNELLGEVQSGSEDAAGKFFKRVYSELRDCAQRQRRRWTGEPSLRTTALMNEAYLKLVSAEEQSWKSRSHFFAVAAQAMRHILIDQARRKSREKRGGEVRTLSLETLKERLGREVAMSEADAEAFVVLNAALERLEAEHPRAARGVECRFFGGMTIEETAEALGVSERTVSRDWTQARMWLYREMERIRDGGEATSDGTGSEENRV